MAQRRMFSLKIIDTDLFLDMPMTARLLYYDLSMRADDDGFVASPKKIQRMIGCSDDDLKLLIAKQFIIPFESGVCVIKHWRIHNYIRTDRYTETMYTDEKQQLVEVNGNYEIQEKNTNVVIPNVIPNDNQKSYQRCPQVRLGKDSIGKDNNICSQVEELWSLYPNKKGKATAIKKIPRLIQEYGFECLKACIERYIQEIEVKKTETKYIKHGSTFFNGGYMDYLEENFIKEEVVVPINPWKGMDS